MTPIRTFSSWTLVLLSVLAFASACEGQDSRPKKPAPKDKEAGKEVEKSSASDGALRTIQEFIAKNSSGDKPKINKSSPTWKTKLPKFPKVEFTKGKVYYWNLETNKGNVKVRFLPGNAPNHVTNFLYLTELGFFDGLSFHRVIPNFMAQGGCPQGNGRGNPGYKFNGEFPKSGGVLEQKHDRPGLLSMANAGAGTDGSQFFLTFVPTAWLDGKHTIFGEVVEGMDTLKTLEKFGSRAGRPSEPLKMVKATISVQ